MPHLTSRRTVTVDILVYLAGTEQWGLFRGLENKNSETKEAQVLHQGGGHCTVGRVCHYE